MIIELTVCYIRKSNQIRDHFNKIYWYEWSTDKMYFNANCISKFLRSNQIDDDTKESTLGEIPFNTKLWLSGQDDCYYIMETPQQILNLIKKAKNN